MKKLLFIFLLSPFANAESESTNTETSTFEIHLLCKSKYMEMETQIYLNNETESWMIVPTSLLSPAAKDTKRPIKNFKITDEEITGYYRFDFIERKRAFSINRKTGSISYTGNKGWAFSGTCEKYDQINLENKF
tara:strand:+ start:778 stop:1179 length:402 start_codon:yes stop_codon:yes gene_type:complete